MHHNKQYDHRSIEAKWRKIWESTGQYKVDTDYNKPKYYVLGMFPYPSGIGLHIGHALAYTITDVAARYKTLKGFNVLHPMGWDSFGLPAEQFAIKVGRHPEDITTENVARFKEQLALLGCSYDWDREIFTSNADYYRWTQWLFLKLFKAGLVYESDIDVLFCPELGTVMSNEEVQDGRTVAGGHKVIIEKRRQWIFKITKYADRLLQDLDLLNWPEFIKEAQRNWIGESHGVEIVFELENKSYGKDIRVFTTRPDTIGGIVAICVSINSNIAAEIAKTNETVQFFINNNQTLKLADKLSLSVNGIHTNLFVLHPISKTRVPVIVANYVYHDYGTGAIMCVPSCNNMDFELAKAIKLDIPQVYDEHGAMLPDAAIACPGGTMEDVALLLCTEYMVAQKIAYKVKKYKLRDWVFSRQRFWGEPIPVLHAEDGSIRVLNEHELPLLLPKAPEYINSVSSINSLTPLEKCTDWINVQDANDKYNKRDGNVMPQWAGSCWYFLRFCDSKNAELPWARENENYWMPVDLYVGGAEHAVLHLLYARFWHKAFYDLGLVSTPEPFTTLLIHGLVYADSYRDSQYRYYDPESVEEDANGKFWHPSCKEPLIKTGEKMSKSKLNGVAPDDVIDIYGADAFRLYLMFMGPVEQDRKWETRAVTGCRRFLCRLFFIIESDKIKNEHLYESEKTTSLLLDAVGYAYENRRYNLVVSSFMEHLNSFEKLPFYPMKDLKQWIIALAPLAPYICSEMWFKLTNQKDLYEQAFPLPNPEMLKKHKCVYAVQFNGKFRGTVEAEIGSPIGSIIQKVQSTMSFSKYLAGKVIDANQVLFVQDKVINIISDRVVNV